MPPHVSMYKRVLWHPMFQSTKECYAIWGFNVQTSFIVLVFQYTKEWYGTEYFNIQKSGMPPHVLKYKRVLWYPMF